MIKYEDIEWSDGRAESNVLCLNPAGGDLRPIVWDAIYGGIGEMLMRASMDILSQCDSIPLSEAYPGLPLCLEPIAEAVRRKG